MNRIEKRISEVSAMIQAKLKSGQVTEGQITELHCTLDLDDTEHMLFQETKSFAHASGKLSFEEATTVYAYLGNTVEHFNSQGICVKVVLTKLFQELLGWKTGRAA